MINPVSESGKKPQVWSTRHLQPLVWLVLGMVIIVLVVLGIGEILMSGQNTVEIGNSQANGLVEVHKGDHVRVSLAGNPTTGYNWDVSQVDSQILKQVGDPQFQADSNALGSGGMVMVEFEAVGTGTTTVQLIYHRSWETGTPPLQTFAVTVRVYT